jgi:hypothetical protein
MSASSDKSLTMQLKARELLSSPPSVRTECESPFFRGAPKPNKLMKSVLDAWG